MCEEGVYVGWTDGGILDQLIFKIRQEHKLSRIQNFNFPIALFYVQIAYGVLLISVTNCPSGKQSRTSACATEVCVHLMWSPSNLYISANTKARAAQKGQQWQRCCQEISLKKPSWQEISLRTIHARKFGVDQSGNIWRNNQENQIALEKIFMY